MDRQCVNITWCSGRIECEGALWTTSETGRKNESRTEERGERAHQVEDRIEAEYLCAPAGEACQEYVRSAGSQEQERDEQNESRAGDKESRRIESSVEGRTERHRTCAKKVKMSARRRCQEHRIASSSAVQQVGDADE